VKPLLPRAFDAIGTPVQSLARGDGRTIYFTDTGEAGWRTILFVGGAGTSARSAELVAFLDSMRRGLKLRLISVERSGFGDTPFDPAWGFADYVSDVRAVLDGRDVDRFVLVAVSGGGTYAGHIASELSDRLISVHFAAALSRLDAAHPACAASAGQIAESLRPRVGAPRIWWTLPPDGVVRRIPGFADRAADEGARAFFIAGQGGDPAPMAAEIQRFCLTPADVSRVTAPLYLYYGLADTDVPPDHGAYWAARFGSAAKTFRRYADEGHDVQYRHWDQLLLDAAGMGDRLLVCDRGRTKLVATDQPPPGATPGLCAWTGVDQPESGPLSR
jgi:pimeloyl-ACP methyl ester carboxylesterase